MVNICGHRSGLKPAGDVIQAEDVPPSKGNVFQAGEMFPKQKKCPLDRGMSPSKGNVSQAGDMFPKQEKCPLGRGMSPSKGNVSQAGEMFPK